MSDRTFGSVLPAHEAAELFRLMAEEIRECAVFLMDTGGFITVWNKAAEEMKGYTADEAIGQHLGILYTIELREKHWPEHNLRAAAESGFYREENWRRRKDGSLFWANISITALRDEQGVLLGFSKITLDLTQHRLLERCEKEKAETDLVLQAAHAATWRWNTVRGDVTVAPHFFSLLSHPAGEATMPFDAWLGFIAAQDRATLRAELDRIRRTAPRSHLATHVRLRRRDGGSRWFYVRADWLQPQTEEAVLVGVCVDIDALKQAQLSAATEKEQAQVTLSAITDGVITTDLDGTISLLNPVAERLTGWTQDEASGRSIDEVVHPFDLHCSDVAFTHLIRHCIEEGNTLEGLPHAMLSARDGQRFSIECAIAPITLADGKVIGAVLVFHDVTEARRMIDRLGFEASHDALTGLVNRREFGARLARTLARVRQAPDSSAALLYMDLDQFKIVNDTCGHAAGDDLLHMLSQVYRDHVRERDTLARIGGDEFALIVDHCTVQEALLVAEKLRDATRKFRYVCHDRAFSLGVSIGLIPLDADAPSVEEALRQADHACYIAKETGRNRIHVHQHDDAALLLRRSDMDWVTRLHNAIESSQLQLYYQPIMPVDGKPNGLHYEILLRLRNGNAKVIAPTEFLPAAERYDVMPSVDRWVLRTSLEWLQANPAHVAQLTMCTINLSRRTLADPTFQQYAVELIDAMQVPPEKLCFEITENGAITHMQKTISFIQALAARGCRFSLDDFGTGMTSFSYLKQLPVDFIKIDGSFIQTMASSPIDYEMVRFTNDISHMMGRKTIAEYVTDDRILSMLREIQVDFAQGYFVGEPQPLLA